MISEAERIAEHTWEAAEEDCDILIADSRYGLANALMRDTVPARRRRPPDAFRPHRPGGSAPGAGHPDLSAVMYLLFLFTINFGGAFIDFFDQFIGTLLVDGGGALLTALGSPDWLTTVVAGGVGGGIRTVATFIPIIGCLYLFLSFLEDSGYMARAAFVMDRLMRAVGLPGKSFIPLIVGFGCNVPAIMATRTLENRRDRIITVMMAPFMSCGARLPVYALFAAAFFPEGGQNLVFALYLIGIGFAVMTGLVLKGTLLKGETTPFVMELPPYHLPTLRSMLLRTWDRLKQFVFRAGRVIVPVVLVLTVLGSLGTDGTFGNENTDRSVLAAVGKDGDAGAGADGYRRRQLAGDRRHDHRHLRQGSGCRHPRCPLRRARRSGRRGTPPPTARLTASICWPDCRRRLPPSPKTWRGWPIAVTDPLGLEYTRAQRDQEAAAEQQEVAVGTFGAMASRFDGQIGAFAYLLAVLLYMPCVAATAAIWRETGPAVGDLRLPVDHRTGLRRGRSSPTRSAPSVAIRRTARPGSSASLVLFAAALIGMRMAGQRDRGALARQRRSSGDDLGGCARLSGGARPGAADRPVRPLRRSMATRCARCWSTGFAKAGCVALRSSPASAAAAAVVLPSEPESTSG